MWLVDVVATRAAQRSAHNGALRGRVGRKSWKAKVAGLHDLCCERPQIVKRIGTVVTALRVHVW